MARDRVHADRVVDPFHVTASWNFI
jgi:hypothetical protein